MMNTTGLLFRDLPAAFRFDEGRKIADIMASAHTQVKKAIEHSCYPYVENNIEIAEGDLTSVLYQRDIRDAALSGGEAVETVELKQNRAASQNILDIEVLDDSDGLRILLEYSSSRYDRSSMERFEDVLYRIAEALISTADGGALTVGELKKALKEA